MKFGIGQSVRRTEDSRFVTGQGQYTEDLHFGGEAHVAFLRSPYAHARITAIDTAAAEAAPGVVGVLTWRDVEAAGGNPMPCMGPLRKRGGSRAPPPAAGGAPPGTRGGPPIKQTPKPLLAKDQVTFAGEAIAMVAAET